MQPEEIDALLDEANRLLEDGKPDESLRCLDRVDAQNLESEDRIEWGSLRAWALSEMGRDEEALEAIEPLLEEFPRSARLLATLGVVLSNNEELEDARDALEEALDLVPEDEVALANLALVYEKMRDYEHALELYDRALELGADMDWIMQRRAVALTEMCRYKEAKSTLKRYLSLVPDDAAQWIALGILHSDDEEYEDAFSCYQRVEALDADSPTLRLNWGVTAVKAGNLRLARQQLRLLQHLEPETTRPWLLRAFILEEDGQRTAARVIYERILTRARFKDHGELSYAFEMAMDFFARHRMLPRCERLLTQAYEHNACSVELCDAYREATGEHVQNGYWFSLMIEADYRPGLSEVRERGQHTPRYTRFVRAYQVVARNHDEAVGLVMDFARRMGERNPVLREFVGTEKLEEGFTGIYEVEADSYVFADESS